MKKKRKLNPRGEAWGVIWDPKKPGTGKLVQRYCRGVINGVPFETGPKPDAETLRRLDLYYSKPPINHAARRLKKAG
ncbi:MAG: hypothetical protein IT462_10040 [Planctomycetes bacterium]|nr:hypothetical protein [Planctomycetota bacterium]